MQPERSLSSPRLQTAPADTEAATLAEDVLRQGYVLLENLVAEADIAALGDDLAPAFAATPLCEGPFYGEQTQRFGSLLTRSPHAAAFVMHPLILAVCERVLGPWCDRFQLNLTQGLAIHPGAPAQFPHRDQDMWRGDVGRIEYLVNVMWPFTDYTAHNGATRIWPESHAPGGLDRGPEGKPVVAEMGPGSALIFLGSTLHGAGANHSNQVRRGMIISYCLGWLKPYENQWLAYPPAVARGFPEDLAALVGYRQHRPNLGNVEGRCPSLLLKGATSPPLGAADELRPDQAEAVLAYAASQQ